MLCQTCSQPYETWSTNGGSPVDMPTKGCLVNNPFFNRGPIADQRFYFPRPRETREVLRLIAGSQNCALVGPMKSGKTSLLLHLARLGGEADQGPVYRQLAAYLSFEGLGRISQEQFFQLMIRETARQSSGRVALLQPRFEAREGISFLELRDTLDQLEAAGESLVFLLDEVEMASRNPAFDLNFFSALRSVAARPGVCFVTASDCPLHEVAAAGREIGSPFADLFSLVRLRPLEPTEGWQRVRALAFEAGVDLEPEREFITGLGGGFPFHLQVVAHEAFECATDVRGRGRGNGRSSAPLSESQRLYVASRAYEQVEPVLSIMWDRLGAEQREAALAATTASSAHVQERLPWVRTPSEVDGFIALIGGRWAAIDGLVERFLRERRRDAGRATVESLNSPGADRATMYGVVRTLMRAVEARDRYARGHADLVTRLAAAVAQEMAYREEMVEGVRLAARVHDIGRVSISDVILLKPGPLDEIETEIMRTHPVVGAQILDAIDFPWAAKPAVRHHHERLDGSGYPDGLMGDEIPPAARIVAVADVVAAMVSDRPYRDALNQDDALTELQANAGVKYDGGAVEALVRLVKDGFLLHTEGQRPPEQRFSQP